MTRLEHRIMNPVLPVSRCNISYTDIVIRIPEIATTFWWGTGRSVFNAEARRRGGNGGKGKTGSAPLTQTASAPVAENNRDTSRKSDRRHSGNRCRCWLPPATHGR